MIKRYESIAAIRAHYLAVGQKNDDTSLDWYGGEAKNATIRLSETGDTSLVSQAEILLDRLDTQIETPRKVWTRSPAGAFPCIPDVLAGLPTPMRRQREIPDERAPITILAATMSSAGISADILRQRGITILALVMALSRTRPVSLQQLTCLHGDDDGETVFTATINTTPLDLATACYVLTSSGFSRRLTYDLGVALNGFNGQWPQAYGYKYGDPTPYYTGLVSRLGHDPRFTLVIQAPELRDELIRTPLAWVNNQLARFANFTAETEGETYA